MEGLLSTGLPRLVSPLGLNLVSILIARPLGSIGGSQEVEEVSVIVDFMRRTGREWPAGTGKLSPRISESPAQRR